MTADSYIIIHISGVTEIQECFDMHLVSDLLKLSFIAVGFVLVIYTKAITPIKTADCNIIIEIKREI